MDEYLAGLTCANCDGQKELTLVSGDELWISVCDGAVLIDGMPHFVLCECCYRKILEEATSS
jgi:hypothetical protein